MKVCVSWLFYTDLYFLLGNNPTDTKNSKPRQICMVLLRTVHPPPPPPPQPHPHTFTPQTHCLPSCEQLWHLWNYFLRHKQWRSCCSGEVGEQNGKWCSMLQSVTSSLSPRSWIHLEAPTLSISNPLVRVTSAKYLGVQLTENLHWEKHVHQALNCKGNWGQCLYLMEPQRPSPTTAVQKTCLPSAWVCLRHVGPPSKVSFNSISWNSPTTLYPQDLPWLQSHNQHLSTYLHAAASTPTGQEDC